MYSLEMEMVCRKWWLKAVLGLLDAAIQNAYIIYSQAPRHKEVSRYEFELTLQKQMVENTLDNNPLTNKPITRKKTTDRISTKVDHMPDAIPDQKRKVYKVCSAALRGSTDRPSAIRTECSDCQVGLCIDKCYKRYHTEKNIEGIDVGPKRLSMK
jgi:hypothetical protein